MLIHLSDAAETDGKVQQFDFPFEREEISFQAGRFPVLDRGLMTLRIENIGNKELVISGKGEICVGISCDRCLTQTKTVLPLSFVRKLDMKAAPEEVSAELDGGSCPEGTDLDTDALFFSEVLLNWPARVLCRPDCKGLCPQCGRNLNEGSCNCQEPAADPRMSVIRDIFKEWSKEV